MYRKKQKKKLCPENITVNGCFLLASIKLGLKNQNSHSGRRFCENSFIVRTATADRERMENSNVWSHTLVPSYTTKWPQLVSHPYSQNHVTTLIVLSFPSKIFGSNPQLESRKIAAIVWRHLCGTP